MIFFDKIRQKCFPFCFVHTFKIKESLSPHPLRFFCFDFFYDLYTFGKNKDYFHPTTYRRSPRIFDLSYSRSKKGEERSIKVLTSSPKTIKLNLQLIEEEVIIPFLLLEKGLTWSRSTLQNPLLGKVKM